MKARGMCLRHYGFWWYHGDPLKGKPRILDLRESYESNIHREPLSGCALWGGHQSNGYGSFSWEGERYSAHRLIYEWEVGPIPEGYEIDHLCRVQLCVEVTHLEAVPPEENWRRGMSYSAQFARATHCIYGHPFDEVNTYLYVNKHTGRLARQCRTCNARRDKLRQPRRKKRRSDA